MVQSPESLTLTDDQVLENAHTTLEEHLELEASGYKCTTDDLFNVLLGVASNQGTIESVCSDLLGTPDPQTIRNYINEQITVEELPKLEEGLNKALVDQLPARVWRHARDIAMDFHDRPYYGQQEQEEAKWVRGKAKNGTTRFYRIATAYVIVKGLRFTLGIRFVLPEDTISGVVQLLHKRVQNLGIVVQRLLLDRGFAQKEVHDYLSKEKIPALIACPIRGKKGGTRALCKGRKGYKTGYTFNKNNKDKKYTAELVICRVFVTHKRTKKRRAMWWLFISVNLDLSPRQVRRLYRRRFGIETSYRCASKVRGWTTSRNPAYRFLLMGLGLLLTNVWVALRWCFTQIPRRGERLLNTNLFQLNRFAKFIWQALQRLYGYVQFITAIAPPLMN